MRMFSLSVRSSRPKTLPILPREACDKNDVVKDVPEAKSGSEASLDESILKKDPAAEKDPAADAVDSDKAKAMFSAHAPSQPADFWSKLKRPAAGAIKGALKKDIPAAKSGAEASFGTKNDPALKPVIKIDTALKKAAVCGEALPSVKEPPEEEPAPAASAWQSCAPASANPLCDPIPRSTRRSTPTGTSRPRSFQRRRPPRR